VVLLEVTGLANDLHIAEIGESSGEEFHEPKSIPESSRIGGAPAHFADVAAPSVS
jgi:hypothetical protein